MSKIILKSQSDIKFDIVLVLSEEEANALTQICGYGPSKFTEWFYKNLGKSYLKPHEQGLVSLFKTVNSELPRHLSKVKKARELFYSEIKK